MILILLKITRVENYNTWRNPEYVNIIWKSLDKLFIWFKLLKTRNNDVISNMASLWQHSWTFGGIFYKWINFISKNMSWASEYSKYYLYYRSMKISFLKQRKLKVVVVIFKTLSTRLPLPLSLNLENQLSMVSHSRWTYTKEDEERRRRRVKKKNLWLHAVTCCDFCQDWTTKQELGSFFPYFLSFSDVFYLQDW